jgi:uncharacterized membrane protein YgaE (UPF0421/DUF939 family)
MKAQNKFKKSQLKENKDSYKSAKEAVIGTTIVFAIAILLTIFSKEIALGFILYVMFFLILLIGLKQSNN